mmetsp:Transcript_1137/g.1835  ORF Transcript_1137/g.1835 Transcript_1137/m.1835 type:complete len:227 (-) Transcript_1137:147-827(-)|eukprot:CAMPEP_0185020842 /NCGR_PEP_ID=MMETSP1103-20130426/3487_1 /TAXON_ID=36769 /ORGANISM="Paraphysomonas bandaiensis, Strain Caron Lab Isolate" /LENGTH=226 /DNA_ID=CAMNT_0027551993 /DNA_START=72 /DNA_END=752 /DNA_ORIENTATION=-
MLRDVIGLKNSQIVEDELGDLIEQLKVLGWKDMRPWNEFFAVFKPPQWDYRSLEQRITANFLFYRTNYVAIFCGVFVVRIILAPVLFLCITLCAAGSFATITLWKDTLRVGDIEINEKMKMTICAVISFVFLGLCGALEFLLWGSIIGLFLVSLHMVFRPRSVSSQGNKYYEESKLSNHDWSGTYATPSSAAILTKDDPEAPVAASQEPNDIYRGGLTSTSMRKRN